MSHLEPKKTSLQRERLMAVPVKKQPLVVLSNMQLEFSLCEDGNTRTPLSVSFLENMSGRGLTSAGNKEKEIKKIEY